ncbi:MAG: M15 family metallopeptidase [Saprospiraceae bacterium]
MSLVNEQAAFLLDVAKLILKANKMGWTITGGELYRTVEQQEIYIKTGRSKTMNSNHLKRLAIDLNFFRNGQLTYDTALLEEIGRFWESLTPQNSAGMFWKTFKDVPHFERRVPVP